jgi:hypothetical protein
VSSPQPRPQPPAAGSRTPRRLWPSVVVVVVVVAIGLCAASLVGAYLGLPTPLEAIAPTSADVQSGKVAAAERAASTKLVSDWVAAHPAVAGAKHLGDRVISQCSSGGPGHVQCELSGRQYDAWSGDFATVAAQAKADLVAACGPPAAAAVRSTPGWYGETDMESFGCPGGIQVDLTFFAGKEAYGSVWSGDCADYPRVQCLSGVDGETVLHRTKGYDWVALRVAHQAFYQS